MADEPLYSGAVEDAVVSETQAWLMLIVGLLLSLLGMALTAFGFMGAFLVAWPLAGVIGLAVTFLGIVSLGRAQNLGRVKGSEGAQVALWLGGLFNATMGLVLLMVGLMGLGLFFTCGALGSLVALLD